jgi:hypothetical protein
LLSRQSRFIHVVVFADAEEIVTNLVCEDNLFQQTLPPAARGFLVFST